MKAKEIRELTDAEAQARLRELREEMFNLRLQQQTARLARPSRIRQVRRDVARLETVLRQRRLRPAAAAAGT